MATAMSQGEIYIFSLLVLVRTTVGIADYYFENYCGSTLSIGDGGGEMESGTSSFNTYYSTNQDCTVTLTTDPGRKILITWYDFDLETDIVSCPDTMYVYNGLTATGTPLNNGAEKCGYYNYWLESRYPNAESTGTAITFRLQTDGFGSFNNFKFTYTSFTTAAVCNSDEHKCDNGKCIKASLKDDGYDNCGDGTDTSWANIAATVGGLLALGLGIMIAVIVGVIVGGILICVCCGCLCYHLCCKNKQPANQVTVVHAAPPPQQGTMQMQMHGGMQGPGPV